MIFRRTIPLVLVAVTACEDPVDLEARAGSFNLPNACGGVTGAPDGRIFTFSRASSSTVRVDQRTPAGTSIWSVTLPGTAGTSCIGYLDFGGNLVTATTDTVYSLAAATGAVRWKLPLNQAQLAIGGAEVLAGTRSSNQLGAAVYSIDVNTGAVKWTRPVPNQSVGVVVDAAQPTVYGIRRHGAAALRPADGSVIWESTIAGSRDGNIAAIASDGSLAVPSNADFTGDIDYYSRDGALKWTSHRSSGIIGPPVIDQLGTIYAAYPHNVGFTASVHALSPTDGSTIWSHDFDRIVSDIVVDTDRTVFVIARSTPDSAFQLYGLRDGNIVSAVAATGVTIGTHTPLLLHYNKLIYYVAGDRVVFTPTAGISVAAPWPMANRDPMRTNRRVPFFPPD
jgi:outer membrane protein assembly factor BamB